MPGAHGGMLFVGWNVKRPGGSVEDVDTGACGDGYQQPSKGLAIHNTYNIFNKIVHNQNQAISGNYFPIAIICYKFFLPHIMTESPVEVVGLQAVYWPVTPGTLGRPSPAIAAIPHTSTETSTVITLEH